MKNVTYANKNAAKIRGMALCGVAAAIICIFAPWKIPIGPIPITLSLFAVYFTSAVLGWKRGTVAVGVYILLGAVGLPVFSGFVGGIQAVAGVTGGYIIGYIPLAAITGLFSQAKKSWVMMPLGMILGTVALYTFGTAWYCLAAKSALLPALSACVIPFVPFDLAKIAAATMLAVSVRPILDKIS